MCVVQIFIQWWMHESDFSKVYKKKEKKKTWTAYTVSALVFFLENLSNMDLIKNTPISMNTISTIKTLQNTYKTHTQNSGINRNYKAKKLI